jgi:hypothetical protein
VAERDRRGITARIDRTNHVPAPISVTTPINVIAPLNLPLTSAAGRFGDRTENLKTVRPAKLA